MRNIKQFIGLLLLLTLPSLSVLAVQVGDKAKIEFSGRMVPTTSCQINGDQLIKVAFGNVAIDKIDSGEFIRPLPYSLENCGTEANTVIMMFKATPAGFDATAMSTNITGLGVQILKDGQPLALNQFFKLADPQHPPELKMQLVKAAGAKLQQSPFTAVGTLLAEYL